MKIFTIANQKGGVAKTTTTINVGHGLALRGKRVLIVDLDVQGNDAACLGMSSSDDLYYMLHPDPGLHKPLTEIVSNSGRKNLDIVRSHKRTDPLVQTLTGVEGRHLVLAEALDAARVDYDVILLDCAPSAGLLQIAAMVASDYLIIPTELNQLSSIGIQSILTSLQTVLKISRSRCRLAGILPVKFDRTTKENRQQLKHLASVEMFKSKIMPPVVRDAKCPEAVRAGKTLWEFAPRCHALIGYKMERGQFSGQFIGGYGQVTDKFERLL